MAITMEKLEITIEKLIELLNLDLELEYSAAIQYINHAAVMTGAAYGDIIKELKVHANFEPLRLFFQRMSRTMYTEIVGEIYLGAAGILRLSREDLRFRPAVSEYKKLLQAAGKELVLAGNIGPQTEAKLAEPIIDADRYAQYANKIWDLMLTKHSALSP